MYIKLVVQKNKQMTELKNNIEQKKIQKVILPFFIQAGIGILFLLPVLFISTTSFAQTIAVRSFSTGNSTNSNLIINKPSGVVAGDIMFINISKYPSNTVPSSAGWIPIAGPASMGTTNYSFLLYRIVTGTEGGNFNFALGTNNYCAGGIVAFSGVDITGGYAVGGSPGGPFDVAPGTISTTGNSTSTQSVTSIITNHNNAAVVMFGMNGNNPFRTFNSWTTASPGALTEIYDYNGATYIDVGAAWKLKTTAGSTGASSLTLSGSSNVGGILIALKPPCTPPAAPTVTSPVQYCKNATATALTATGSSLLWYTAATGGSGSLTAPTPVTTNVGSVSYYVSQTIGCESPRAQINVITNSLPVASVPNQNNVSCYGGTDGTITVVASGGTSPYTFSINNGVNYFNATGTNLRLFVGLLANTAYQIKVKDTNGCISN